MHTMAAHQAKVIDLKEYRLRRQPKENLQETKMPSMVWCPVWVMMPAWCFR
jgi:hypothetical protein